MHYWALLSIEDGVYDDEFQGHYSDHQRPFNGSLMMYCILNTIPLNTGKEFPCLINRSESSKITSDFIDSELKKIKSFKLLCSETN